MPAPNGGDLKRDASQLFTQAEGGASSDQLSGLSQQVMRELLTQQGLRTAMTHAAPTVGYSSGQVIKFDDGNTVVNNRNGTFNVTENGSSSVMNSQEFAQFRQREASGHHRMSLESSVQQGPQQQAATSFDIGDGMKARESVGQCGPEWDLYIQQSDNTYQKLVFLHGARAAMLQSVSVVDGNDNAVGQARTIVEPQCVPRRTKPKA